MIVTDHFNVGDMKVPTFYSMENDDGVGLGIYLLFPVVGVVFGGIHCAGWFFDFPSSDEAMLWRVSSAVLTGIAFLLPIVGRLLDSIFGRSQFGIQVPVVAIVLLGYVLSRSSVSRGFHLPQKPYSRNACVS